MITQNIISFFLGLIELLINLIPSISLPSSFLSGMGDVAWLIGHMAYFLPFGTFIGCISFIFLLHNIKFVISIFNFIIRKVPFIN